MKQETNKPNVGIISNVSDRINESYKPVGDSTLSDSPVPDATHESSNKKLLDNIKFIAYVLSMLVTFFVAITNFAPYFESRRGKFVVKVHGEEVISSDTRTSLVYMDEDSIDLANFDFFPIISNPSKYPLKDVLLIYTISPKLAGVSITDYYDSHGIRKNLEVTNKDNKEETLLPSFQKPSPFSSFVMKNGEQAIVTLQATYKGIKEPFIYETTIYTKKIVEGNRSNHLEFVYDDVEHFLVSNNIDTCNIYILDSGTMYKHENFICSAERLEVLSDCDTNKEYENGEKEGRPWYIYIVGIILGIMILAVTFKLTLWFVLYDFKYILNFELYINDPKHFRTFFGCKRNSAINLSSIIIRIIFSVLIVFVLLFVVHIIIFGESYLTWMHLASLYVVFFGLLLISLIFNKTHNSNTSYRKTRLFKLIIYIIWFVLLSILFIILDKHGIMPMNLI